MNLKDAGSLGQGVSTPDKGKRMENKESGEEEMRVKGNEGGAGAHGCTYAGLPRSPVFLSFVMMFGVSRAPECTVGL